MVFEIITRMFNFSNLSDSLDDDLRERVIEAREEWNEAKLYFNCVSEPDLIDHAIYLLEAAESKYRYLLKKRRGRQ